MCGFVGIVGPVDRRAERIATMLSTILHRGPDDEGQYGDSVCGLGHRRLSIIDLSPNGRQPMGNEDGSIQVVFNGEIYNFQDLRQQLIAAGHSFASRTDSEVLVHLYEERGDAMVDALRGMFAFALWDSRKRRLLLARDHFGQKPLFFAEVGQTLVFASEIKAVLASGLVDKGVDNRALDLLLRIQVVPSPHTCYASVRRLGPATLMVREYDGSRNQRRYWSLAGTPIRSRGLSDAVAEAASLCREAVREQLVADVPVGVFLSGGIDSTLVYGMTEEQDRRPDAFTLAYDDSRLSEDEAARRVTRGAQHHVVVMRPVDAMHPETLVDMFDEPFTDVAALPLAHLARHARQHVKVALTGDGGDELFGGYEHHVLGFWLHRFARFDRPRAGAARLLLRAMPDYDIGARWRRLRNALSPMCEASWRDAVLALRTTVSDEARGQLYAPDFLATVEDQRTAPYLDTDGARQPAAAPLASLFCPSGDLYLADRLLLKSDMASMAASLECRSPLLDVRLAEFAMSLPPDLKVRGLQGKDVLRRVVGQRFSRDVWRRPKMGFSMPLDQWLRADLREIVSDTLLAPNARSSAYLRRKELTRLYGEHVSGRRNWRRVLWSALLIELWLRRRA